MTTTVLLDKDKCNRRTKKRAKWTLRVVWFSKSRRAGSYIAHARYRSKADITGFPELPSVTLMVTRNVLEKYFLLIFRSI